MANIMVISMPERCSEIGLRRALGATKGQIRVQFLAEAILRALACVLAGAATTAAYADARHVHAIVPAQAWAGGIASAFLVGAISVPPATS
ncbi:MAG: ABC transporter permease [Streptosporangiaceae bacterium]